MLAWLLALPLRAQPMAAPAFEVVPLGVKGGLAEGNLSACLVSVAGNEALITEQLTAGNALGVKVLLPEQGRALQF